MKHCPKCRCRMRVRESRVMATDEIYRLRACTNCTYITRTVETVVEWSAIDYSSIRPIDWSSKT
jgi:transcriptional regulator NrdR family protein